MIRLFKRLCGVLLLTSSQASAQPITVEVKLDLPDGATAGLRGDTVPLDWDRSTPLLDPDGDGFYEVTLDFPEGSTTVAYKAVIETAGGDIQWEAGGNRLLFPGRMALDRRRFGEVQSSLPTLTVSSSELDEDLVVLRESMAALHPGRTLHNTQEDLEQIDRRLGRTADSLKDTYSDAIPVPQVYLAVARAVAAIRDGHTQVSMYNQGDYVTAALYTRPDRAPFTFRLVGRRMIVTGDATPDAMLPPGTEVLSMDGRPVAEIIEAILPFASADGSNDAKRLDELQVTGVLGPAERFDVIYSLLFEPTGGLTMTVKRPGESETDLAVERTTRDARRETLWERDSELPRSIDDLLRSRMLNDSTAYINTGSFATFNMSVDYEDWLLETFKRINASGAGNLVVDLRDVAGGMDDAAELLLRHILQESITVSFWRSHTAYQQVPDAVRPHVRSWSNQFYDVRGQVSASTDGVFKMPARPDVTIHPAKDAFKGNVAVLVDATASSATFYLAKAIKENGVAPLIGQETGGSLKGLNAGLMAFLNLPNSGVVVDLPLIGSRPIASGPDRGVVPDILVEPEVEAIVAGRDQELEAALALFANRR